MQHQDFNIIFQPPKEATSGFVIIKKCRLKSRSYDILQYRLIMGLGHLFFSNFRVDVDPIITHDFPLSKFEEVSYNY